MSPSLQDTSTSAINLISSGLFSGIFSPIPPKCYPKKKKACPHFQSQPTPCGPRRPTPLSPPTPPPPFSSHTPSPNIRFPIPRLPPPPPSMASFQKHLDEENSPVIICGLVDSWPAMTTNPWASPAYLLSKTYAGKRLVPVELGSSYTAEDW